MTEPMITCAKCQTFRLLNKARGINGAIIQHFTVYCF